MDDRKVIGTDDYRDLPGGYWGPGVPLKLIEDTTGLSRFCVEGIQVARALRKGMEVDAVVWLRRPKVKNRKPGQVASAKGVETVFREWLESHADVPVFVEGARNETLPSLQP